MRTAVEYLVDELQIFATEEEAKIIDLALLREKDQLGALYLTLLLNTPDITKFDFEEWYNQNTKK
jgi:hypothetical protein